MPQLFLALDGRIDFLKKTNPFAAPEKKPANVVELKKHQVTLDEINARARNTLRKQKTDG